MEPHPPERDPKPAQTRRKAKKAKKAANAEGAKRKTYIKDFALHKVLSDCMGRCLAEFPEDPCLFIAKCLLEEANERQRRADAERFAALREEMARLQESCRLLEAQQSTPQPLPPPAEVQTNPSFIPYSPILRTETEYIETPAGAKQGGWNVLHSSESAEIAEVSIPLQTEESEAVEGASQPKTTTNTSSPLTPGGEYETVRVQILKEDKPVCIDDFGTQIETHRVPSGNEKKAERLQEFRSRMLSLSGHHLISIEILVACLSASWKPVESIGLNTFSAAFYAHLATLSEKLAKRLVEVDMKSGVSTMFSTIDTLLKDANSAVAVHAQWQGMSEMYCDSGLEWFDYSTAASAFIHVLLQVNAAGVGFLDNSLVSGWLRLFATMSKVLYEHSRIASAESPACYSAEVKRQLAEELGIPVMRLISVVDSLETVENDSLHTQLAALLKSRGEGSQRSSAHCASFCVMAICGIRLGTFLTDCVRLRPWVSHLRLSVADCVALGAPLNNALCCDENTFTPLWRAVCWVACSHHTTAAEELHVAPSALLSVVSTWHTIHTDLHTSLFALEDGPTVFEIFETCVTHIASPVDLHAALTELKAKGCRFPERDSPANIEDVMGIMNGLCHVGEGWGVVLEVAQSVIPVRRIGVMLGNVEDEPRQATPTIHALTPAGSHGSAASLPGLLEPNTPSMTIYPASPRCEEGPVSPETIAEWDAMSDDARMALSEGVVEALQIGADASLVCLALTCFLSEGKRAGAKRSTVWNDTRNHALLLVPRVPGEADIALLVSALEVKHVEGWKDVLLSLPVRCDGESLSQKHTAVPLIARFYCREKASEMAGLVAAQFQKETGSVKERVVSLQTLFGQSTYQRLNRVMTNVLLCNQCETDTLVAAILAARKDFEPCIAAAFKIFANSITLCSMHVALGRMNVSILDTSLSERSFIKGQSTSTTDTSEIFTSVQQSWARLQVKGNFVEAVLLHMSLSLPDLNGAPLRFKARSLSRMISVVLTKMCTPDLSSGRITQVAHLMLRGFFEYGLRAHHIPQMVTSVLWVVAAFDPSISEKEVQAWNRLQEVYAPVLTRSLPCSWKGLSQYRKTASKTGLADSMVNGLLALYEQDHGWNAYEARKDQIVSLCHLALCIGTWGCDAGTMEDAVDLCVALGSDAELFEKRFLSVVGDLQSEAAREHFEQTFISVRAFVPIKANSTVANVAPGDRPLGVSRIYASWRGSRKTRYVMLHYFCSIMKHNLPRTAAAWQKVPTTVLVERFANLIEMMFVAKDIKDSYLSCAGEAWTHEGLLADDIEAIPKVMVTAMKHIDPAMDSATEGAWLCLLEEDAQFMGMHQGGAEAKPPTVADIHTLTKCMQAGLLIQEKYVSALHILDPLCPQELINRGVAVSLLALEECRKASAEALLTLEPTYKFWPVLQALFSAMFNEPDSIPEVRCAWVTLFIFRIAPQLEWELAHAEEGEVVSMPDDPNRALVVEGLRAFCAFVSHNPETEDRFWEFFLKTPVSNTAVEYQRLLSGAEHDGDPWMVVEKIICLSDTAASRDQCLKGVVQSFPTAFNEAQFAEVFQCIWVAFLDTVLASGALASWEALDVKNFECGYRHAIGCAEEPLLALFIAREQETCGVYERLGRGLVLTAGGQVSLAPIERLLPRATVHRFQAFWSEVDSALLQEEFHRILLSLSPCTSHALVGGTFRRVFHCVLEESLQSHPSKSLYQQLHHELLLCGIGDEHYKYFVVVITAGISELVHIDEGWGSDSEIVWDAFAAVAVKTLSEASSRIPSAEDMAVHLSDLLSTVQKAQWVIALEALSNHLDNTVYPRHERSILEAVCDFVEQITNGLPDGMNLVTLRTAVEGHNRDALLRLGNTLSTPDMECIVRIWTSLMGNTRV